MTVSKQLPKKPLLVGRPSWKGHLQIARIDHWFKNIFVVPGIIVKISVDPVSPSVDLLVRIVVGFLSIGLVASSNYVINEVMDAPMDRLHPTKFDRPVPAGRVSIRLAYVQWIVLMAAGVGLGLMISVPFAITMLALWGMGCIYNLPPLRSKDIPIVDVLTEAINNPLRMLAGWFLVGSWIVPPTSLLLSYWLIGCYFMTMKRFGEYLHIGDAERSAAYRKSFRFYNEPRLLVAIMFYGSAAMLFFGSFMMRYRMELILTFPFIAWVMASYLALAFKENSAVQRPEYLYREPMLMIPIFSCVIAIAVLLFVDVPIIQQIFSPTLPTDGLR